MEPELRFATPRLRALVWSTIVVAGWSLPAVGCLQESQERDGHSEAASTAMAPLATKLSDVERCQPGRVADVVAVACREVEHPYSVRAAPLGAGYVPELYVDSTPALNVALPPVGSEGMHQGTLRFHVQETGEYVVFLSTPNAPFEIVDEDDDRRALTPSCSLYTYGAPGGTNTGCPLVGAYVVQFEASRLYMLRLGPTWVGGHRIVIRRRRGEGARLATYPMCSDAELSSTLPAACERAGATSALNATPLGSDSARLSLRQSWGVHLIETARGNEGAVAFTAPYTADYAVYLGTPNVGVVAMAADGAEVRPVCQRSIDAETAQAVAAAGCPLFPGAFLFRGLAGGATHRLELGPITPQRWVRTLVAPTSPDSDGDGLADNLDRCPDAPFRTPCGCDERDCASRLLWVRTFDSGANDEAEDVALGPGGTIAVVGTTGPASPKPAAMLATYDAQGALQWWKELADVQLSRGRAVASDPQGRLVVAFEAGAASAPPRSGLRLFDRDGSTLWTQTDLNVEGAVHDVAFDERGSVLLTTTRGVYEFPSGEMVRAFPVWDHLVRSIAVDASGNVATAGRARAGYVIQVERYDAQGGLRWARTRSSGQDAYSFDVALDSRGAVIASGSLTYRNGGNDLWLRKFDDAGHALWTVTAPEHAFEGVLGVDGRDDVLLARSLFDYAPGSAAVLWLRKLDWEGHLLWSQQVDLGRAARPVKIVTDDAGKAVVAGSLGLQGTKDLFVAVFSP